ncbi:hypothetical protein MNBD_CPR01-256 [hydrothermal vent metagenome]|uniref:Uncharacterized protein n=1 Tax=hydrothermal vent metagenome TaxID=652676 RepID=A0A3B0V615_9ZZZZ
MPKSFIKVVLDVFCDTYSPFIYGVGTLARATRNDKSKIQYNTRSARYVMFLFNAKKGSENVKTKSRPIYLKLILECERSVE